LTRPAAPPSTRRARRVVLAAIAAATPLWACANARPLGVASPVVDVRLPSVPTVTPAASNSPSPRSDAACVATPNGPGPERLVEWRWRERTTAVARCQVSPVDDSSEIVAGVGAAGPGAQGTPELSVNVVRDDESATEAARAPRLDGKRYVVRAGTSGLEVTGASGAPVGGDEARRVRALAATEVRWPGAGVATRPPATGQEVPALAGAVREIADVRVHGEPARDVAVVVRFAGPHAETWGDALVFDVEIHARTSDAGMCHRWELTADLAGRMRLRADDGTLVDLALSGQRRDTEALCPGVAPGTSSAPRTCDEGTSTLDVTLHVAGPCPDGR